ncbi:MAG: hypothetical protein RMK99_01755 [Anaerolineales bacterium]|nr:hypothetical protein [Anaerolineales bacterium]
MERPSLNAWALLSSLLALVALSGTAYFVFNSAMKGLPTTLQTPSIIGSENSLPSNPTTEFSIILTQKAIAGATAAARPPITPLVVPTGIYDTEQAKATGYKYWGFKVENYWFGLVNGNIVTVFAGAPVSDPQQGKLHVNIVMPNRLFDGEFATPEKNGALRVIAESNNRLTLMTTNGTTYYFDVPAMRFVSSLEEVVSTATPLPTYTPVVVPIEILPTPEALPASGYPPLLPSATSAEGYPASTPQATAVP